jgi:hypothetical protein
VVLSRRLVALLVALVMVVVALGIMGLLGGVGSASPDDDHNDKGRTLTVLTKTREEKVVDLGPQGPSHGDMRVVNAPLYDASGKERIGRLDLFCVVTDPADEPAEEAHMAEFTKTFTLPGGEISVQGVNALPKLSGPPPKGVDAISGGTGEYAGVRGEHRFETRGTKFIDTFHFIG